MEDDGEAAKLALVAKMQADASAGFTPIYEEEDDGSHERTIPIVFDKMIARSTNGTLYVYIPLMWGIRVGDHIDAEVLDYEDVGKVYGRNLFKVTSRGNAPSITIPKRWNLYEDLRIIIKVHRRVINDDAGSPFEKLDKRLFERGSVLI